MTNIDLDKSRTAVVDALRAWMRDEFAKLNARLDAQDRRLDVIQDAIGLMPDMIHLQTDQTARHVLKALRLALAASIAAMQAEPEPPPPPQELHENIPVSGARSSIWHGVPPLP